MTKSYKVAIIGGGISGATIALQLGDAGIETILFEKNDSLLSGPPMCHLHAGGSLYPSITIDQCKDLMRQSIEMVRLFDTVIDFRPTLITIPKSYDLDPNGYLHRLEQLVAYYKDLVAKDKHNQVLGNPEDYYKIYHREDVERLSKSKIVDKPSNIDDWMIIPAQEINWDEIKFPVFMVQEYGWNLFRLGAHAQLALESDISVNLSLNTCVSNVEFLEDKSWKIETRDGVYYADYLVNAAGFRTGLIDDMVDVDEERMVEFKAAYIAKWNGNQQNIPEIIFHGERSTPEGMAQLTPYPGGYYQLHGMTEDITLFEDGLTKSSEISAQPQLPPEFIERIEEGWETDTIIERTLRSINHVAKYLPAFAKAKVGAKPLYGAQQIPGTDVSLRVANVSFPKDKYARCEMIKASTALEAARYILENIKKIYPSWDYTQNANSFEFNSLKAIEESQLSQVAESIAEKRFYPTDLTRLIVPKKGAEF